MLDLLIFWLNSIMSERILSMRYIAKIAVFVAVCFPALSVYAEAETQTGNTFPQNSVSVSEGQVLSAKEGPSLAVQHAQPAPAEAYPKVSAPSVKAADKKPVKNKDKKTKNENEAVHNTGQKVFFADGRETTVQVREDLLRKDLKKMPVWREDGSTVYMTPKQAARYLKRKEKRQAKREQKLEKALKQQIKQKEEKKSS